MSVLCSLVLGVVFTGQHTSRLGQGNPALHPRKVILNVKSSGKSVVYILAFCLYNLDYVRYVTYVQHYVCVLFGHQSSPNVLFGVLFGILFAFVFCLMFCSAVNSLGCFVLRSVRKLIQEHVLFVPSVFDVVRRRCRPRSVRCRVRSHLLNKYLFVVLFGANI